MDRFTFQNDTMCFVELGSEEQVTEAVQSLNDSAFQTKTIIAKPLRKDFIWGPASAQTDASSGLRYFYDDGNNAHEAVKPLIEGRRMMLSVQTPGWGAQDIKVGPRNKVAEEIINQYFGKFGIEAIGGLRPFYGDKKENPRLLCFLDFKTRKGADQAVAAYHDTEIEGRRTWLKPSDPAPWRAHQIGKVDKALLAELQDKGLLPRETYEDKFVNPVTEKRPKQKKSKATPKKA